MNLELISTPKGSLGKSIIVFTFFHSIAKVPHYPWNWNIRSEIIFSLKKHEVSCLVELTHCHCPDIFFTPLSVWLTNPEHAPKYPKQCQKDSMTCNVLPKMLAGQNRDGCQVQCNDWLFKIFWLKPAVILIIHCWQFGTCVCWLVIYVQGLPLTKYKIPND